MKESTYLVNAISIKAARCARVRCGRCKLRICYLFAARRDLPAMHHPTQLWFTTRQDSLRIGSISKHFIAIKQVIICHMNMFCIKANRARTRLRSALQRYEAKKLHRHDCNHVVRERKCAQRQTNSERSLGPAQFCRKEGIDGDMNA